MYAPIDVQLDCDEKDDRAAGCTHSMRREQIIRNTIVGAPDFIVEILLHPHGKRYVYKAGEVYDSRVEYWMVDVEKKKY